MKVPISAHERSEGDAVKRQRQMSEGEERNRAIECTGLRCVSEEYKDKVTKNIRHGEVTVCQIR